MSAAEEDMVARLEQEVPNFFGRLRAARRDLNQEQLMYAVRSACRQNLTTPVTAETEIFLAAYEDSTGRDYWAATLSEPTMVVSFADILAIHKADLLAGLDGWRSRYLSAFRAMAKGDTASKIFVDNSDKVATLSEGAHWLAACHTLNSIELRPADAVAWLQQSPRRADLLPASLHSYLTLSEPAEAGVEDASADAKPKKIRSPVNDTVQALKELYADSQTLPSRKVMLEDLRRHLGRTISGSTLDRARKN